MKQLVTVILLLSVTSCFAQDNVIVSICRYPCSNAARNARFEHDTAWLYHLNDEKPVATVIFSFPGSMKTVGNLSAGDYRLVYTNIFRQHVTQTITLSKEGNNVITINPGELESYPQNTLAKLQDRDSIAIYIESTGCEYYNTKKLVISKECDQYAASLYELGIDQRWNNGRQVRRTYIHGKRLLRVVMNEEHQKNFTRFENELNYIPAGGCTSRTSFDVSSKYFNIKARDASCQWSSFSVLMGSLFGREWYSL